MPTLNDSLYTLVKAAIGAETLIFSDQNSPRPPLPYWTLKTTVQRGLGRDTVGQGVTDDGDLKISGVREATVMVQRCGNDSVNACGDLRDVLSKVSIMESWQRADIALYDISDVRNVPYPLDNGHWEQRASLDLFIRFGTELLDRVGIIQQVDIAAQYDDDPDSAQTITAVLY